MSNTFFGLGLWNSLRGTISVEVGLLAAGLAVYLHTTSAKDRTGVIAFRLLMAVLVGIYLANPFGPPPPDTGSLAIIGNAAWVFVVWAFWPDRHRSVRTRTASAA